MTLISRRVCLLAGVKDEDLKRFVEEIRAFVEKEEIPQGYAINIYRDWVESAVIIEIEGPTKQPLEELDLKIYSKFVQICERERFEYHECKSLEVLMMKE